MAVTNGRRSFFFAYLIYDSRSPLWCPAIAAVCASGIPADQQWEITACLIPWNVWPDPVIPSDRRYLEKSLLTWWPYFPLYGLMSGKSLPPSGCLAYSTKPDFNNTGCNGTILRAFLFFNFLSPRLLTSIHQVPSESWIMSFLSKLATSDWRRPEKQVSKMHHDNDGWSAGRFSRSF